MGLIAGSPLRADEPPVPRTYPERESQFALPSADAATIARQHESFETDLAKCEAGDPAFCTSLGIALRRGKTQPQNRPVAELLLRRACDMGDPRGCFEVAQLLQMADTPDGPREYLQFFGKACETGELAACIDYASAIEQGAGQLGNLAAADDIRRSACKRGSEEACMTLVFSLTYSRRSIAHQDEGRALLERLCSTGNTAACSRAAEIIPAAWRGDQAAARATLAAACEAGEAGACMELGKDTMRRRAGKDDTAATARALSYFDRACGSEYSACVDAAIIREEAMLDAACNAGQREACQSLAAYYGTWSGPLSDPVAAQEVLAGLCYSAPDDAQRREQCWAAGDLMRDGAHSDPLFDPVRTADLMTRACDAGDEQACIELAVELFSGSRFPQDLPRGYELFLGVCEAGDGRACNTLARRFEKDPATPLPSAGSEFAPVSFKDQARQDRAPADSSDRNGGTDQDRGCFTTTVDYGGVSYTDRICPAGHGVTNGTPVAAGSAPWQALIWRPDLLGTTKVPASARVLCGGTVIRTGWVLTAAHCLVDQGLDIRTAGHRLRLGVSNPTVDEGISYRIIATHAHELYTGVQPLYWDIALIRYDPASGVRTGPAYMPKTVATDPKPMTTRAILPATPAYVYGWGLTEVGRSAVPTSLLRGTVLLKSMDACQRSLGYPPETRDTVLCADRAKLQQACNGDSGGPVIVFEPGAQGAKTPVVIGVISSGKACGTKGRPSRFTRVAHPEVQSWMRRVLAGASPPQRSR